jgi:hypothetical protein
MGELHTSNGFIAAPPYLPLSPLDEPSFAFAAEPGIPGSSPLLSLSL